MSKTKVYYNSACPVCAAGIAAQQRKLEGCDAEVDWIDVHADNEAVKEIDADLEFVRERLHVVDEAGVLQVGAAAFHALWQLSPRQRWLARMSGLPILGSLIRWSYNRFAALLYRWNRWYGRW